MADPARPEDADQRPLAGSASARGWPGDGTRDGPPAPRREPAREPGFTPATMLVDRYRVDDVFHASLAGKPAFGSALDD